MMLSVAVLTIIRGLLCLFFFFFLTNTHTFKGGEKRFHHKNASKNSTQMSW